MRIKAEKKYTTEEFEGVNSRDAVEELLVSVKNTVVDRHISDETGNYTLALVFETTRNETQRKLNKRAESWLLMELGKINAQQRPRLMPLLVIACATLEKLSDAGDLEAANTLTAIASQLGWNPKAQEIIL